MKGLLSNIRYHEIIYSRFKSFSLVKIIAFAGIAILNGLNLIIRIEYKLKSQIKDLIADNDLCTRIFWNNTAYY